MTFILVGLAVMGAGALAALVVAGGYERELKRMARALSQRDQDSNERVFVTLRTRGTAEMAQAVNDLLDEERDRAAAELARRHAFQQDLASLSHDIRTPLAGAQGYLQLHERKTDAARRAHCLREAAERLADLRSLVDQLFEYTKAASPDKRLSFEDVPVLDELSEALVALYPAFARRGWEPSVRFEDEGVTARADAEALRRVFANLLTNALRYGSDAPRIEQVGRELRFSNEVDDPHGLDVERMFTRFYRADHSRTSTGSGLGLAIVANLARAMRMDVRAELAGPTLTIALTLPEAP